MAEDPRDGVDDPDVDRDDELPLPIRQHLRRAYHLERRAARAPLASNEERKALKIRDQHIEAAVRETAEAKLPLTALPEWVREKYGPEPA